MVWSTNGKRDYKKEYSRYQGSEQQKKNRAARGRARYAMMKAGKASKGDGKDVAHARALSKGGSNSLLNLFMQSKTGNRSFSRNRNGTLKSEKSKKERR